MNHCDYCCTDGHRCPNAEVRIAQLEAALLRLRNEVHGSLYMDEPEIRYIIGNTNFQCIELRLREADALLTSQSETAGYPPATPPSDGWPKAGGVQVPCPCGYGGYSCRRRKNHLKANEYCWRDRQAAGLAQQTTVERINRSRGTCTCGSSYGPHDPDCPAADTSKTKGEQGA